MQKRISSVSNFLIVQNEIKTLDLFLSQGYRPLLWLPQGVPMDLR